MAETLREKQVRFAKWLPRLIDKAFELGYEVTGGEWLRLKSQAQANAASGAGISNSLHLDKLAIDLNLFKDGRYITDGEGHRELGAWWKSQGEDHAWGGDFPKKDFNHYSISHAGRK